MNKRQNSEYCLWEKEDEIENGWQTGCNEIIYQFTVLPKEPISVFDEFKYCPYCSDRIKAIREYEDYEWEGTDVIVKKIRKTRVGGEEIEKEIVDIDRRTHDTKENERT